MACGCNKRARAAARGQQLAGYRVYLNDEVYPPLGEPPYFSVPDAKAKIRQLGGGTVRTEYRSAA